MKIKCWNGLSIKWNPTKSKMSLTRCSTCSSNGQSIWPSFSVIISSMMIYMFINNNHCIFHTSTVDDKDEKASQDVLAELENIDDECDQKVLSFNT